jgi:hypothetical protein
VVDAHVGIGWVGVTRVGCSHAASECRGDEGGDGASGCDCRSECERRRVAYFRASRVLGVVGIVVRAGAAGLLWARWCLVMGTCGGRILGVAGHA